jgi:HEAT repeat protein
MQHLVHCRWLYLCLALVSWLGTGCAEGPFGLAAVNPYLRQKWQADEKYGPTFHRRLAELRGLRASTHLYEAQQKERIAAKMAELVQTDESSVLRCEAVGVLGAVGIPSVTPVLHSALSDSDEDVRIAACHAWGEIGGDEGLATLVQVAEQEGDTDVRLAAVEELAKFKDPAAVAVLGKALDDSDPAVQFRAVQSLRSATGMEYGDSIPGWRDYLQGRASAPPPPPTAMQRVRNWF